MNPISSQEMLPTSQVRQDVHDQQHGALLVIHANAVASTFTAAAGANAVTCAPAPPATS